MAEQSHLFLDDTYLLSIDTRFESRALGSDRVKIIPVDNIVHAQGGGQPSDDVTVNDVPAEVVKEAGRVVLLVPADRSHGLIDNDRVTIRVDRDTRLRHAALHTFGHIIANVLDKHGWFAKKANHFPSEARIEFTRKDLSNTTDWTDIEDDVKNQLSEVLSQRLPVHVRQDKQTSFVQIGDLPEFPCAGTHVRDTGCLATYEIISTKIKKGVLKVRYDAKHTE